MVIHDISAPLRADLPSWPKEEGLERKLRSSMMLGDSANVSQLSLGAHTGTHVDAPAHFLQEGAGVDSLALDALVGPAVVVDLRHIRGAITSRDLDAAGIAPGAERVLARTRNSGWSEKDTSFREDFTAYELSAAQWLVDRGVRLVGIDYLSIELFGSGPAGHPVHKTLLGKSIVILEGIDLASVAPGEYFLVTAPLLIPDSDGAPARAFLLDGMATG